MSADARLGGASGRGVPETLLLLGSGRRAGIASALGVSIGGFIWAILFTFGIGALLQAFPETLTAMRLLGGGYLVYLGMNALRSVSFCSATRP